MDHREGLRQHAANKQKAYKNDLSKGLRRNKEPKGKVRLPTKYPQ